MSTSGEADNGHVVTSSRIPVQSVYVAESLRSAGIDVERDCGLPGRAPFTRGRRAGMYRERLWDMATYGGISSPKETNERFKFIIANTSSSARNTLAVALDLPTQVGLDPDDPLAVGEVGRSGVSVASLRDLEVIYDDIPLERVRVATVANGMGNVALAWFIGLAVRRGEALSGVVANLQNDPYKEFTGRGLYIYPVDGHMRLALDAVDYCIGELPHWRPMSVCGSQLRWGGGTAIEEVAFAVAHAQGYIDGLLERGLKLSQVLPIIEFHMATDNEIMEEAAKFRALRQLWAHQLMHRYGLDEGECVMPSIQTYSAGYTLTAQQPMNNIVRIAMQVISSVLGGVDYVATCSYDEAISTPTKQALMMALRTQQIIAYESGLPSVADPLGGSYYVEWLTAEIARRASEVVDEIYCQGGPSEAIASGWTNNLMTRLAFEWQVEVEERQRLIVGVNIFEEDEEVEIEPQRVSDDLGTERGEEVRDMRKGRSSHEVARTLRHLEEVTRNGANTIPATVDAVLEEATVQEICDVFRAFYGVYTGV
jgi:methylmalonyl-CoA mutase N-terminal domain/subunit